MSQIATLGAAVLAVTLLATIGSQFFGFLGFILPFTLVLSFIGIFLMVWGTTMNHIHAAIASIIGVVLIWIVLISGMGIGV